ncbi:MAG: hypothetical protein RIC14_00035 [Filomicrobium sp.]
MIAGITWVFVLAAVAVGAMLIFWGFDRTRKYFQTTGEKVENAYDKLEDKFRAEWTDADEYVARARRLWPSLQSNPFFWVGVATSTMICVLGILGATALSQGVFILTALWVGIFVVANLAQAAIAVLGDTGHGEWYEFKSTDRPRWHWPVLAVLLAVNFIASFTGSSNVAEVLTTTSEINASSLEGKQASLKRFKADLDALRTRRLQEAPGHSAEAIQAKATELESAAEREAGRGGCGRKCEAIRRDAVKWRALANDAIRERKLGDQIAILQAELKGLAADGTARTVASPHAALVEDVTDGAVTQGQVNRYLAPLFWLMVSVVDIALWLWAGDYAGRYRQEQYKIRAEAANAWLENGGFAPRYKISEDGVVEDVKALPAPPGEGDTFHIDLSESAQARIDKSPRLQQIQALFDAVFIQAEGSKISVGQAYELFAKIRSEQGERKYMAQPEFRSAITDYCEILGIELISNQIIGYKVGLASTQEAAE